MATDLNNLSISELKKIKKDIKKEIKADYKQKLIDDINKLQKVRDKINQNQNQNQNQNPKHLKSISRSVSRIKQFRLIHLLICAKHLRELSRNMTKE